MGEREIKREMAREEGREKGGYGPKSLGRQSF